MIEIENIPGWCKVPLSEISHRITKGTTPTSLGFSFTIKGILFVKVESLLNQRINHSLCAFIDSDADEALTRSRLQESDVLFSIAGTLGRVAIVHLDDLPANTNQAVAIIRLVAPILPKYIAQVLSSHLLEANIREQRRGVGLQNLNLQQVSEFKVPLPPLNEQRRIVAKIEALKARSQQVKEALEAIPPLLEQFRQSVLAAAFRGDLTADWREKNPDVEPASVLLERIRAERRLRWEEAEWERMKASGKTPKDNLWKEKYKEPASADTSNLPLIPDSWTWAALPELGELNRGKSKHRPRNEPALFGGPYPFIQTGDVSAANGTISEFSQTYSEIGLQQSRLWTKGTLCITIAANIAETAILGFDACFPDSIVGFLPKESHCSVRFVEFFMRTAKNDLERFAPATAQKNINLEVLSIVAVPLPPLEEQQRIVAKIDRYFAAAEAIEEMLTANNEQIQKLDQSVLAKAFHGELVPQDPNDEPASVLLERIQAERANREAEAKAAKKSTGKTNGRRSRKVEQLDSESVQLGLPGVE